MYSDIEASDVQVVGGNYTTDAGDADSTQGQFSFSLQQFMDPTFTDAAEATDVTQLGENLYFTLSMQNPVANLVYSIVGKSMKKKLVLFKLIFNLWDKSCSYK